jgi:hypothetical protein
MGAVDTIRLEELDFSCVTSLEPERDDAGAVRIVAPQPHYANARGLPLNAYGAGPFCKFRIPAQLRVAGVYVITIDGEARYVGECTNFAARFNAGYGTISPRNCFKGGQETNCRVNNLICNAALEGRAAGLWFYETQDFKAIEARLRAALRLPWNRV